MTLRVSDPEPIKVRAQGSAVSARAAIQVGPQGPAGPPGPGADVTAAEIVAARDAAVAASPHVGSTPPADTSRIWIDTSSVFTTDIRTQRDLVNVTVAGTVTVTLGATPVAQSEIVWRTRGGATTLLQPTTNYTLTTTTLSVPSSQVGDVLTVRYNYQAVNGTSAAVAISDQPIIADSFDRANSTTTLGNAETGQTWFVGLDPVGGQPAFGITSNQAYVPTNPNNAAFATVNTGSADHTVQAKIITGLTNAQIGLWAAGDAAGLNGYYTSLTTLSRRTNGAQATVSTFVTPIATGDTVRITRKGDTVSVYVQPGSTGTFNLYATATDATHHGTYAGLRAGGTFTTIRWDDFKVFPA